MISLEVLLLIFWTHYVADYILQTHTMALNKSKSNAWLTFHIGVYTLPFLVVFGWQYATINAVLHFVTDYFTSRMNSKFWNAQRYREFFLSVGLDQAIHLTTLTVTYVWLFPLTTN